MRCAVILLAVLLLPLLAAGDDLIRFTNGRSVTGRVVAEDAGTVTIEVAGGGRLTVPRSRIREILRDVTAPALPGDGPAEGVLRAEHFFLWSGDRRLGTRALTVRREESGDLLFTEEHVFLDSGGREDVRVRTVERSAEDLSPREILYRETSAEGSLLVRGEVRDGALGLTTSLPGDRRTATLAVPPGLRFPLAARHAALTAPAGEEPREGMVFDPREQDFFRVRYESAGARRVDWEGEVREIRVLLRHRGNRAEEEVWLDPGGACLTEELNGPAIVSVLSTRARVAAFLEGGKVEPSREEQRVRPEYVHPEAGFRLRKPTLSWSFEPGERGARKVLSLSSVRHFAWVDVFVLAGAPEGGTLASLAIEMERRFAGSSEDFRKLLGGATEVGGEPACEVVATSRNKGEELQSLLVGLVRGDRTFYFAMACPRAYFERALPEFRRILASVEFLE